MARKDHLSLTLSAYICPMFGVRLRSLFTSRWMALLWGVLVCLTAIQYVGAGSDKDSPDKGAAAASPDGLTTKQRQDIANAL